MFELGDLGSQTLWDMDTEAEGYFADSPHSTSSSADLPSSSSHDDGSVSWDGVTSSMAWSALGWVDSSESPSHSDPFEDIVSFSGSGLSDTFSGSDSSEELGNAVEMVPMPGSAANPWPALDGHMPADSEHSHPPAAVMPLPMGGTVASSALVDAPLIEHGGQPPRGAPPVHAARVRGDTARPPPRSHRRPATHRQDVAPPKRARMSTNRGANVARHRPAVAMAAATAVGTSGAAAAAAAAPYSYGYDGLARDHAALQRQFQWVDAFHMMQRASLVMRGESADLPGPRPKQIMAAATVSDEAWAGGGAVQVYLERPRRHRRATSGCDKWVKAGREMGTTERWVNARWGVRQRLGKLIPDSYAGTPLPSLEFTTVERETNAEGFVQIVEDKSCVVFVVDVQGARRAGAPGQPRLQQHMQQVQQVPQVPQVPQVQGQVQGQVQQVQGQVQQVQGQVTSAGAYELALGSASRPAHAVPVGLPALMRQLPPPLPPPPWFMPAVTVSGGHHTQITDGGGAMLGGAGVPSSSASATGWGAMVHPPPSVQQPPMHVPPRGKPRSLRAVDADRQPRGSGAAGTASRTRGRGGRSQQAKASGAAAAAAASPMRAPHVFASKPGLPSSAAVMALVAKDDKRARFMSFQMVEEKGVGAEPRITELGAFVRRNDGVQLVSACGDFAEWHRRREGEAPFEEGDVVGFDCEGHISRATRQAKMFGVISRRAVVEGSTPPQAERWRFDTVAYTGIVPVKVLPPPPRAPRPRAQLLGHTTHGRSWHCWHCWAWRRRGGGGGGGGGGAGDDDDADDAAQGRVLLVPSGREDGTASLLPTAHQCCAWSAPSTIGVALETEAWAVPAGQESEGKLARDYGMLLSAIVSPADTVNIRRSPWSVGLRWLLYALLLVAVFYALAQAKLFHRRKVSGS
jgi:hypothetical protein